MSLNATERHAEHRPDAPVVEAENLCVRYGRRPALEALNLRIEPGALLAVLGPNGAGKSTFFKTIAGLIAPSAGVIRVYGSRPGRHTCIAYLPQRSEVDFRFPVSVLDVTLMGCAGDRGLLRRFHREDRKRARECLAVVSLADLAARPIGELSGGQQQRVFIARALAQGAELMLLDEPTGGLDPSALRALPDLLAQLRTRGVTTLIATHDIGFARTHLDQVLLLNRRVIAHGTPETVLTPERMAEAFEDQVYILGATGSGQATLLTSAKKGGV